MEGHKAPTIVRLLREGNQARRGSGRPSKITAETKKVVEDQMHSDVETTVYQLHMLLTSKDNSISLCTVYPLIENKLPSNVCNNT